MLLARGHGIDKESVSVDGGDVAASCSWVALIYWERSTNAGCNERLEGAKYSGIYTDGMWPATSLRTSTGISGGSLRNEKSKRCGLRGSDTPKDRW